jgi:hypothetical protein
MPPAPPPGPEGISAEPAAAGLAAGAWAGAGAGASTRSERAAGGPPAAGAGAAVVLGGAFLPGSMNPRPSPAGGLAAAGVVVAAPVELWPRAAVGAGASGCRCAELPAGSPAGAVGAEALLILSA